MIKNKNKKNIVNILNFFCGMGIINFVPINFLQKGQGKIMQKYMCEPCGYVYDPAEGDPDNGIAPGTAFKDIPDDWVCPVCGLGKEVFVETE